MKQLLPPKRFIGICKKPRRVCARRRKESLEHFFPMTCASEKILLGSQTCERKRVRCGEPLSPLKQTPQRSGVCLNQQKAERRNAVPLLPSDSQPGERTAAGWRIARKGRNERERNNWRDSSVLLRPTVCILPEIPRSFLNRLCYF